MGDHLTLKTTNMKKMTLINNRLVVILFETDSIFIQEPDPVPAVMSLHNETECL